MNISWDGIIAVLVIFSLIYIIYTKIKKQTMRDTYDEIKETITGG